MCEEEEDEEEEEEEEEEFMVELPWLGRGAPGLVTTIVREEMR